MTKKSEKKLLLDARDERVLAAIIAGGMASRRRILPATSGGSDGDRGPGHINGWGTNPTSEPRGPACAVGAGLLYAGVRRTTDPLNEFARVHDVSHCYAFGVHSGFEGLPLNLDMYEPGKPREDARRGYQVGRAAWDFFGASGRG